MPAVLAGGLAAGAVAGLGLTLVASVRRRRRDFALLKTLGFTRRQLAGAVAWQSSAIAVDRPADRGTRGHRVRAIAVAGLRARAVGRPGSGRPGRVDRPGRPGRPRAGQPRRRAARPVGRPHPCSDRAQSGVTMKVMTNAAVDDQAAVMPAERQQPGATAPGRGADTADHRRDRRGRPQRSRARLPAVQAVAFGLVIVGAVSGAILARTAHRVALWQVASGALVASVALTAARLGDQPGRAPGCSRRGHVRRAGRHRRLREHAARPSRRPAGQPGQEDRRRDRLCRSGRLRAGAGGRRAAVPGLGGRGVLAARRGLRPARGAAALPGCFRARPAADAVDGGRSRAGRRFGAGGRGPARARRLAGPGRRRRGGVRVAAGVRHDGRGAAVARVLRRPGRWSRCCRSPGSPPWSPPSTW